MHRDSLNSMKRFLPLDSRLNVEWGRQFYSLKCMCMWGVGGVFHNIEGKMIIIIKGESHSLPRTFL